MILYLLGILVLSSGTVKVFFHVLLFSAGEKYGNIMYLNKQYAKINNDLGFLTY